MSMKFTQVPTDTFKNLQLNAGIFASTFDPSTGEVSGILCATSGGASFEATPEYEDFGEDIDNVKKNTKELKKLSSWEYKASGTAVTLKATDVKRYLAAADVDDQDETKIVPRNVLHEDDFEGIWWIGDYSDVNEDEGENGEAGFIAIHMMNTLSTGGFKLTSSDKAKGTFDFEYTCHPSILNDDEPIEIYVKAGKASA